MTIERAWLNTAKKLEKWQEIDEDRASRELANKHGDNALTKLNKAKTLETRFAHYRITD